MPAQDQYIAFDLETTGLSPEFDRVIEIGAVRFDALGREIDRFDQRVNPGRPSSPGARAVHGIDDAELAGAPAASEVLPRFLAFLGTAADAPLIAHNAGFDAPFLGCELGRSGLPAPPCPVHDTLALSRLRLPSLPSHRLDRLVEHFRLGGEVRHRALEDALLVKEVWLRLDGPTTPAGSLTSYPIHDPRLGTPPPRGWDRLAWAVRAGCMVWIVYEGGTRGEDRRAITPRRFSRRGGVAYVTAFCHLGGREKNFRLDRIREYTVADGPGSPDPSRLGY